MGVNDCLAYSSLQLTTTSDGIKNRCGGRWMYETDRLWNKWQKNTENDTELQLMVQKKFYLGGNTLYITIIIGQNRSETLFGLFN